MEQRIIGTGKFRVGQKVKVVTSDGEGYGIVRQRQILYHPENWGWKDRTPRWAYMIDNSFDTDLDVQGIHAESDLRKR